MTLSQFNCYEKDSKEILEFCKEIEGIEAEHGPLAVTGVPDNLKPRPSPKLGNKPNRKRKHDQTKNPEAHSSKKGKKYCPVHGWCSHTAEECISLKDVISTGKRKYTEKRQKTSGGKDKMFSKQEVSVMISTACTQAVNQAFQAHQALTSKKRKVTWAPPEQTKEAPNTEDIQQQVEELKLYRDKVTTDDEENSSSDSSSGSDS